MSALAGLAALVAAALLIWKGKLPKITALLALAAGAGLSGWAGRWLRTGAAYVKSFVDSLTAAGAGAAAGALIALVLVFIVVHDLWPKHKANRTTHGAAFLLPVFAIGTGGVLASVVLGIAAAIGNGLVTLVQAL